MARLRLFYVLDSLEENDVGDQVATLLERLPRSRFEPRVVGLGVEGSLGSRLRQMSVTVHRLGLQGAAGAVLAIPRLRALLRGLRADIVHTFEPWSGAVAQVGAPRQTRVFRSVRGLPAGPRTFQQRLHGWLERRATRLRNRHFTVADALAVDTVRRRFNVDRVEVVPECLDLAGVREATRAVRASEAARLLGMSEKQRAIVVASDFRDRAAPLRILEGVATARVERPDLRVFFLGGGPEEGAARWHAEELHLEDSVVFLGPTGGQHPTLLRVSRGVIDAGSWPSWSRVALESMACGLPTLRWVEDDDEVGTGRYPARTAGPPDRVARDLLTMLDEGPERAQITALCEAEAQRYDVATVADLWTELYTH